MKPFSKNGLTNSAYVLWSLYVAWYRRLATASDTRKRFLTTTHSRKGPIRKDWTEEGTSERNAEQHDSTKTSFSLAHNEH